MNALDPWQEHALNVIHDAGRTGISGLKIMDHMEDLSALGHVTPTHMRLNNWLQWHAQTTGTLERRHPSGWWRAVQS